MKTFSICIPFYNGESTIERCLDSVFTQDDVAPVDLQVIISSGPESGEYLRWLQEQYPIEIKAGPRKRRLSADWTDALALGTGAIRTLLHQDDWYERGTLGRVRQLFESEPDVAGVCCTRVVHTEDGEQEAKPQKMDFRISAPQFAAQLLQFRFCPSPSSMFMSGHLLDRQQELYSERYSYCPELDLYVRLTRSESRAVVLIDDVAAVNRRASILNYGRINVHLKVKDYLTAFLQHQDLLRLEVEPLRPMHAGFGVINARFVELLERLNTLDPQEFRSAMDILTEVVQDEKLKTYLGLHPAIAQNLGVQLREMYQRAPYLPAVEFVDARAAFDVQAKQAWQQVRALALSGLQRRRNPPAGERGGFTAVARTLAGLLRRVRANTPVFIVGFHHSGTRLLAQLLHDSGVFQSPTSNTYESRYVQLLNMLLLPEWNDPEAANAVNGEDLHGWLNPEIIDLRLRADGYEGGPWGHKDPRTGVVLEAWFRVYPDARAVHLLRDPLDVLGTLPEGYTKYTPGCRRPQEDLEHWSDLWTATVEKIRQACRGRPYMEIRYEDLCSQPKKTLHSLASFLGLPKPSGKVLGRIRPDRVEKYLLWQREGRLSQEAIDFLKSRLAAYRSALGYTDN